MPAVAIANTASFIFVILGVPRILRKTSARNYQPCHYRSAANIVPEYMRCAAHPDQRHSLRQCVEAEEDGANRQHRYDEEHHHRDREIVRYLTAP